LVHVSNWLIEVEVEEGSLKADLKGITLSIIKTQAKKVRFESAFKRA